MTRNRPALLALALSVLLLMPAAPAAAEDLASVLGPDGRLVTLVHGSYGELVSGGAETQPEESVLALRTALPEGGEELHVVPATLLQNGEQSAELVYEPESGTTFVFWQSWTSPIQNRLLISSFDGDAWSEPIEVSGPAFAWRTSPAFTVTRDSYHPALGTAAAEGEEPRPINRTILHVLWAEEDGEGRWSTVYAPLILLDGEYVGAHPLVVLDDLAAESETALEQPPANTPPLAPVLRSRSGENAVVAAFQQARTQQVVSVELRFAAGELSLLADEVAAEIEQVAPSLDLASPQGAEQLVGAVTARLGRYENRLKSEILGPLSQSLAHHLRELLESGEDDVATIRDRARIQMVDVGFRMTDGQVHRMYGITRVQLVDVGHRFDGGGDPAMRHDVRSSVASQRAMPAGAPSVARVLVSPRGQRQVVAWQEEDRVLYRESRSSTGWHPVKQLQLNPAFGYRDALDILQRRVDQN